MNSSEFGKSVCWRKSLRSRRLANVFISPSTSIKWTWSLMVMLYRVLEALETVKIAMVYLDNKKDIATTVAKKQTNFN